MSISTGNTYFVTQQSMLFIQECQVNVFLTTCILQGENKIWCGQIGDLYLLLNMYATVFGLKIVS